MCQHCDIIGHIAILRTETRLTICVYALVCRLCLKHHLLFYSFIPQKGVYNSFEAAYYSSFCIPQLQNRPQNTCTCIEQVRWILIKNHAIIHAHRLVTIGPHGL